VSNGWEESAQAWIASMGNHGDWCRQYVLDRPMLKRARARPYRKALDVGCGEGRFCRLLAAAGIAATGIDPNPRFCEEARLRHPDGDYRLGRAEALAFGDGSFDLVVSYLSLIDIEDYRRAICEMARVLAPGGALLIANLTSFSTARSGSGSGWEKDANGIPQFFKLDHYASEWSSWLAWRGIRVRSWHRPLANYMQAFLANGLTLTGFDEPPAQGAAPEETARYARMPYCLVMEWRKSA
jgi:SAM-dependent methyltransferase